MDHFMTMLSFHLNDTKNTDLKEKCKQQLKQHNRNVLFIDCKSLVDPNSK